MERVKPQRGGIDSFQKHRTGLSTVLTQGLFPSNFVTTDLDSDARGERKRSVVFNEEVSHMYNFQTGHRGVFYSECEYMRNIHPSVVAGKSVFSGKYFSRNMNI